MEYAYQPPVSYTKSLFSKILWYINPSTRIQKQASSNGYYTFFPHLRTAVPKLQVPLFTKRQRLYFFVDAGYYFDTDFKKIGSNNFGFGAGFKTRLASVNVSSYKYLEGEYTTFLGAEKKNNIYIGLSFYLDKMFIFE